MTLKTRSACVVRGPRVCLELQIFLCVSVSMQCGSNEGGNDVVDVEFIQAFCCIGFMLEVHVHELRVV